MIFPETNDTTVLLEDFVLAHNTKFLKHKNRFATTNRRSKLSHSYNLKNIVKITTSFYVNIKYSRIHFYAINIQHVTKLLHMFSINY